MIREGQTLQEAAQTYHTGLIEAVLTYGEWAVRKASIDELGYPPFVHSYSEASAIWKRLEQNFTPLATRV